MFLESGIHEKATNSTHNLITQISFLIEPSKVIYNFHFIGDVTQKANINVATTLIVCKELDLMKLTASSKPPLGSGDVA